MVMNTGNPLKNLHLHGLQMGPRNTGHIGVLVLVSCSAHSPLTRRCLRQHKVILGRAEAHHAHRLHRIIGVGHGCRRWHAQPSLHLLRPRRECRQLPLRL
jgi:hypothetical protein